MTTPQPAAEVPPVAEVLAFKQRLREEVAASGFSHGELAERVPVVPGTLSRALRDNYGLPTWQVTEPIVRTCLRRRFPDLPAPALQTHLADWKHQWDNAREARDQAAGTPRPAAGPPATQQATARATPPAQQSAAGTAPPAQQATAGVTPSAQQAATGATAPTQQAAAGTAPSAQQAAGGMAAPTQQAAAEATVSVQQAEVGATLPAQQAAAGGGALPPGGIAVGGRAPAHLDGGSAAARMPDGSRRSRARRGWRVAGVAVVVVVAAVAVVVFVLRSRDENGCVAAGLTVDSGECTGVSDGGFDGFDSAYSDVVDRIRDQNRAVGDDYVELAVMGPLTQTAEPGQLDRDQVRQMLIGAAVAQQRVNTGPLVGDPRPRVRLLLANQGSHQDLWRNPVRELTAIAADPHRHLIGVVALGTSVAGTRDAVQALSRAGIPIIGTITTADDLDYEHVPGMLRVTPSTGAFVSALAGFLTDRPKLGPAIVVWDQNAENRGDIYAASLRDDFHAQLARWIGDLPDQGFVGKSIPSDDRPDMFDTVTINVCQAGARTVLFAGRITDLPPFIDSLSRRACRDRPLTIMTGVTALTAIDRTQTQRLQQADMSVVYAGVTDPHTWPRGEGNPPPGYRDYLTAVAQAGYPPDLVDAYTCLTHDAVLTATRAARMASPGTLLPTPGDVRSQLRNINGAYTIPGCSGTVAFTTTSNGNPVGTAIPVVTIGPDTTR
ncbi:hypothetical protein [Nocardia terpenica]|uniref:Uncharacterized protein n=1 Tax=Nocardia terpenica TaxID=455432 RepID=A0A6G9Z6L1_9NOCA|nr:hypothetical protein [Nocardia terpenica]QIS21031.1 hypothetical protein F6W96_24645 [Nocardia terpenica]